MPKKEGEEETKTIHTKKKEDRIILQGGTNA